MATTIQQPGRHVALERIRVPRNVRALDEAHVQALAGSIKLQGMLVLVRDAESEDADRVVENITSCRRRHEVINADAVVMQVSLKNRLLLRLQEHDARSPILSHF